MESVSMLRMLHLTVLIVLSSMIFFGCFQTTEEKGVLNQWRDNGWCPSTACMQYAQRPHACCYPPEARGTIHLRSALWSAPSVPVVRGSSLRSVCQSAARASRGVRRGRGSLASRSLIPVRG